LNYSMPMISATSSLFDKSQINFQTLGRVLWSGILMALPLTGLVTFFELTQPAKVSSEGFYATKMAVAPALSVNPWGAEGQAMVARFTGVSAQRGSGTPPVFTASDATRALSSAPFERIKAGFYTEFLNKDRHRIAILIVSREPIVDREIPDNTRLMSYTEASTAHTVAFVWGGWLYRAQIEDKGVEPNAVVQKVL